MGREFETSAAVLAFLYADLIVLPLLDAYRRYFGWRMAAYIGGVFYVTMVIAVVVMDLVFTGLGLVPDHGVDVRARLTHFALNYTFWLTCCSVCSARGCGGPAANIRCSTTTRAMPMRPRSSIADQPPPH